MHFFHRKRYRFFYPAGSISLVMLPLFGFFYYLYLFPSKQQYAIPYIYRNIDSTPPESLRKYSVMEIGGDSAENKIIISLAQNKIQQLAFGKDKTNGIHLIIGKESRYNDLIQVLNICLQEKTSYIHEGKHLWILYNDAPIEDFQPHNELLFHNFHFVGDVVMPSPILSFLKVDLSGSWKGLKFQAQELITQLKSAKSFWPIAILYLIMLALTTQKVVRQIQNQLQTTSN